MVANIIIYSDQPILTAGIKSLINGDPRFTLCASCSTVPALQEHLASESPDLALLDLTPEVTRAGLQELQNLAPECKLVLWANSISADFALDALTTGVRGILRKTLSVDAHLQCLHRVLAGNLWFEKTLTDSLRSARRVSLSRRESQLVTLLSRGLKNKEISRELGITEGTVKVYLSHLFQKSGTKDRFDLAIHGLKHLDMAGVSVQGYGLSSLVMEESCRA
jgi:DNA-binding NarL/FixJ family response regulator